jgi:septum formation protein
MIDIDHPLLLASRSPRRYELLERLGIPLASVALDVDEHRRRGEAHDDFLQRVVTAKHDAAAAWLAAEAEEDDPAAARAAALMVADTIVEREGLILGKPESDDEAGAMLRALSGREHRVHTRFGLARVDHASGRPKIAVVHVQTVTTRVWMRTLDEATIDRYVACGEGRDKAGSYGIQGMGAHLVTRIEGSYSAVVGLPLAEVVVALERTALIDWALCRS